MAEARLATTVLLLRDGPEELEVAMIRRSRNTGFMPGVRVYPGGRVDAKDACPEWESAWTPHHGLSLTCVVAGLRETFEEVGLLLARGAVPEAALAERDAYRQQEPPLTDLYARHGLEPAFEDLALFGRWVTPEAERKRYDTWFLLARAPADQALRPHPAEATEGGWFQPRKVLAEATELPEFLAPPTLYTLEELADLPDVDAAFEFARGRIPPVCQPLLDYEDDNVRIVLPGDADHPERLPAYPGRPTRIYYGAGRFWRA